MIRDPDNSKNILICPDCLRDTIEHVKGYGDWWKKNVNNDQDLQKNYEITYNETPNPIINHYICHHCFDDWHEAWDHEPGYYLNIKGFFPEHMASNRKLIPLENPGIDKVCNYPSKCYCGECPNPDQLKFNLHGASKEWWEDEDDGSTMGGRSGRCFELSGKRALYHPDKGLTLVHGTIQNFGKPAIAHGWVEHSDGSVHEPTTGQTFDPMVFNAFCNPVVEKRYDKEEAYNKIIDSGHCGPWHETKGLI